jgi:hypothetical protein
VGSKIFILLKTLKNTQTKPKTQKSPLSRLPPLLQAAFASFAPPIVENSQNPSLLSFFPNPHDLYAPKSRHPLVPFKPNESHCLNPSSYSSSSHLVLGLMDLVFFFFCWNCVWGVLYFWNYGEEICGGCGGVSLERIRKTVRNPKIIIIIIIMWNIKE